MTTPPFAAPFTVFVATRLVMLLVWSDIGASARGWAIEIAIFDLFALFVTGFWVWTQPSRSTRAAAALGLSAVLGVAALMHIINQLAHQFEAPPPAAAPLAQLPVRGGVVDISGPITFDTFDALQATLTAESAIHTVRIDSAGGRIPAARGLARLVREFKLDTHVDATCASACTLVFIAGRSRTLGDDAQVGFHGYRLISTVLTLDMTTEQTRDIAAFARKGVDPDFMAHAMAVPPDQMWFPTHQELTRAGVVTHGTLAE